MSSGDQMPPKGISPDMPEMLHDLPVELHPPIPRGAELPPLDPEVAARLFAGIAAETVDRNPSMRERLAQLPTWQRQVLVVASGVVISAGWLAMMGHRDDLVDDAALRSGALAGVLVATGVVSAATSVRGLERRLPAVGVVALALAVPSLLGALPGAWPGMHTEDGAPLMQHLMCGGMGTLLGALVALPMLLVQRGAPGMARVGLIAAGAGAVAFVVQNLICPLADVGHLVFAHGVGGLVIAALLMAGIAVGASGRARV